MKKVVFFYFAALMLIPVAGLTAEPVQTQAGNFLVSENDKAELQPAESSKETAEPSTGAEEKKESKTGFFAAVVVVGLLTVYFLVKTKKITND